MLFKVIKHAGKRQVIAMRRTHTGKQIPVAVLEQSRAKDAIELEKLTDFYREQLGEERLLQK